MYLTPFISTLLNEGRVAIEGRLHSFEEEDIREAAQLLYQYYQEDCLEMPYSPPAFDEEAALWAAKYFYQAIQLAVIRESGEEIIQELLQPYGKLHTPAAIYSVDLIFRYLPALFNLVKGLAPADMLVKVLLAAAEEWAFSSPGIALDHEGDFEVVFADRSLKHALVDRIIRLQDIDKVKSTDKIGH